MTRTQDWVVVPSSPADIDRVARYCRKLVNRKALVAAGVATVPVPGLDWVTDVGMLASLFNDINHAFGLTPEQVERLSPNQRLHAYKAISAAGGYMVGKLVTRDLVAKVLKTVGVRLTARQVARYVPLAGQAVSAAVTFSALKLVCEQHIRQCMEVSEVMARLPGPMPRAEAVCGAARAGPCTGRRRLAGLIPIPTPKERLMEYVWMVIVGFIVGLVARAIMPGTQNMGWILTAVLGIVGSFVAGFIGQALGFYRAGEGVGFIGSVVGALIVLFIYGLVAKQKA
jgi:uncharacterized membrane protein YeaQ/YmgE (transglycosylase-associated protein family)/uncharacterized protein (DUF697 family)